MSWVGTAILGGAAVSGAASIYGANKAADTQTSAANAAIAAQQQMYQQTQKNLAPYRATGNYAAGQLQSQLPGLTAPINMDEATLQNTPGYQWNLQQGLKSVQNSAAARGLGESGAALKGASTFATGLADSTYQNQFNNAMANKQFAYNSLIGTAGLGENAAAGTGAAATATGQGIASNIVGAGNAQAAGYNAYGAAGTGVGNAATTYGLYNGIYGGNGGGSTNSYGGGSPLTGDAYGGNANNPLPGLGPEDYA